MMFGIFMGVPSIYWRLIIQVFIIWYTSYIQVLMDVKQIQIWTEIKMFATKQRV